MNPISFPRSARFALVALLALPCVPSLAGDQPAAPPAKAPNDPSAISIDFPGGPLSKLLASLANGKGAQLSIIQSAGLDPSLPAFSVRDVHVSEIVAALGRLLEPQGFALAPVGPNLAVLQEAHWTKPPQAFASLRIGAKLRGKSIEEFIAVIHAACEFADPAQKASTLRFKYHPGTKLLFVAGTPREIEVAHQVFGSLPDNPLDPHVAPPATK